MPPRLLLVLLGIGGVAAGVLVGYWRRTPPPPPEGIASMIDLTDRHDLVRLQQLHPGTIILDFHARWCRPCAELLPRLVTLGRRHPEIVIAGVDAAGPGGLADAFAVDALPTLIRIDHGRDRARLTGAPTLAELERWLHEPAGLPASSTPSASLASPPSTASTSAPSMGHP